VKVVDDAFERRNDVFFGAPERGQTELGECRLNLAQVDISERQVVEQVRGTESMGGKDPLQDFGGLEVMQAHLFLDFLKLRSEFANEPNFLHRY
jgi:hypothetical protein